MRTAWSQGTASVHGSLSTLQKPCQVCESQQNQTFGHIARLWPIATTQPVHSYGARPTLPLREKCATPPCHWRHRGAWYTGRHFPTPVDTFMLAPKALLDALSDQASRLFSSDNTQPRAELESQFKALMQGALSKLDVVSREEFDSQMVVLARTRARLEALEKQVAELEARLEAKR